MSDFYLDKQKRVGQKPDWKLGFKQIDIDFHFSETARHMLINTDPAKMMKMVKDANADTVMVYAKDHWGHVYHETEIAHKHNAIKGDLLKEWLSEAKKQGLQTTVFFSLMWDEYAAKLNPDWLSKNVDGTVKRWYGGWRFLSLNSPYRDYIFAHMKELVTNYDFDTIFVDPFNHRLGVNVPDYNQYDQKLFEAQYGHRIPETLTGEDKAIYMDFRDKFFARFLKELYAIIRGAGKNIKITHIYGGNTDYDDYLNVEGDPFGQDYYAPSMKAKVYRAYSEGRPLVMLTERFSRYWDFVPKTREQLLWEVATAFSHNASMMLVDHADIKGELDSNAYDDMNWVYDKTSVIEQNISKATKVIADVALLYHERDEELLLEQKQLFGVSAEEKHLGTVYRGYIPDFVGAFKYLTESHIPFDCVVQTQLNEEVLRKYKMLVIPNTIHMSKEQIAAVQQYVEQGGKLIFTHRSASKDLYTRIHNKEQSLFGLVDIEIEDPYTIRFVTPVIDSDIPYIRVNRDNAYISPMTPFEVLALIQLPAVERTPERWVTHNEPPGEISQRPAAIHGRFGKGEYIYFSYRMFAELLEQDIRGYRKFIDNTVKRIYDPEIKVQAPRTVEANFYDSDEGIKVFLTSVTPGRFAGRYDLMSPSPEPYSYPCNIEEVIPVPNVKVIIRGKIKLAKDSKGCDLSIDYNGNNSVITLPLLETFEIITIKE